MTGSGSSWLAFSCWKMSAVACRERDLHSQCSRALQVQPLAALGHAWHNRHMLNKL